MASRSNSQRAEEAKLSSFPGVRCLVCLTVECPCVGDVAGAREEVITILVEAHSHDPVHREHSAGGTVQAGTLKAM